MGEGIKTRRGESKGITDTNVYLYNEGDECIALTGGWTKYQDSYSITVKNPTDMSCTRGWVGSSIGYGKFYLSTTVDLTDYSKLIINASVGSVYNASGSYGLLLQIGTSVQGEDTSKSYMASIVKAQQDFTLDISSISGVKYITIFYYGATGVVYNLWLE